MHAGAALHLHPHLALDPLQALEHALALFHIGILDQHRRLPVCAVGHERVVDVELSLDVRFLENTLDPEHLLHLVADGELVLEEEREVIAEAHGAAFLVLQDARAERVALACVGFEGQQAFALDHVAECSARLPATT